MRAAGRKYDAAGSGMVPQEWQALEGQFRGDKGPEERTTSSR